MGEHSSITASNKMRCHLASLDSVDWCVVTNLIWFFRSLGFTVSWGKSFAPCDVVAIVRGVRLPPDSQNVLRSAKAVVVFDYVGNDQEELLVPIKSFGKPVLHFRACKESKEKNDSSLAMPNDVITLPLPVNVDLWCKKPMPTKWNVVYIGNRKDLPGDVTSSELHSAVSSGVIDVWGRWWVGLAPQKKLHRPITVYSVPSVYRRSGFSLGLMYPYQREAGCYSSRHWLAPLAGCPVVTERSNPFGAPGIIPGKLDSSPAHIMSLSEREGLADAAYTFWASRADQARSLVGHWLTSHGVSTAARRFGFLEGMRGRSPTIGLLRSVSMIERLGMSVGWDVSPISWLRIWR
jgi:hypothetical protein